MGSGLFILFSTGYDLLFMHMGYWVLLTFLFHYGQVVELVGWPLNLGGPMWLGLKGSIRQPLFGSMALVTRAQGTNGFSSLSYFASF